MLSINTDLSNLVLQKALGLHTLGLNRSIQNMTTGFRINQAKDDAAGYSMIKDLSTRISSMLTVQQNTDEGLSLLYTAEGGLNEINKLLDRLRSLTTEAANGVYGEDSRRAMQLEAEQIIEQIAQIRDTMEYNGLNLYWTPETATTVSDPAVPIMMMSASPMMMSASSTSDDGSDEISSSTPVMMRSSSPMMRAAVPAAVTTIDGAVDFAANETKTITIDGVTYEVKNRQSVASSLSYSKNTITGQITFLCDNFTIKGQADVAHNILINGGANYFYGGNEPDRIETISGVNNCIYGQGNDDTIILLSGTAYGGDGNDNITNSGGSIYGDAGDDIITVSAGGTSSYLGGDGNDTFHFYALQSMATVKGEGGDDTFHVYSASGAPVIDGGSGTNTVATENTSSLTKVNVVGANAFLEEFTAKQTKTVKINGIDYTITNNKNSVVNFVYQISADNQIVFKTESFTIKGDENKVHNVNLAGSNQTFYGGKYDDTILSTANTNNIIYSGAGNDTITSSTRYTQIYSGDGADIIKVSRGQSYIDAGNGNDDINISATDIFVSCGAGDDTVTTTSGAKGAGIYGGSGNNQITNAASDVLINGFGDSDNAQAVELSKNETTTVDFTANASYSIKNTFNTPDTNVLLYSLDPVTGQVSVNAHYFDLTALSNDAQNISVYGYHGKLITTNNDDTIYTKGQQWTVYAGDGDDSIYNGNLDNTMYGEAGNDYFEQSNSYGSFRGGDGDDTIVVNTTQSAYTIHRGENGNDNYYLNAKAQVEDTSGNNIYYINTNGVNITAGMDGDTFYINGNNNTIKGSGGNDYVVNNGANNVVDGGTGDNYYIDNGTDSNYTNTVQDPNSGSLTFASVGESQDFTINGKTYTIINQNADGTSPVGNTITYSVNLNTGVVTLVGSNFTINGASGESHILAIRGDNNIVNGANLADKITVENGTNNIINGNGGNDTLINDAENNSINGGAGSDTITLNTSTNKAVTGGDGDDTINVLSDNNTNIDSGANNDKLNITGSNNIIKTNDGNNIILSSGSNNTINSGNGDNKFTITGDSNTVVAGSGNNTLGIGGNSNNVTAQKILGTININGDDNTVTQINGDNSVVVKGSGNTYSSALGQKDITITGDGNSITTGNEDDKINAKGDSNTIITTGGENEILARGNSNQIQGGSGIDDITVNGDNNTVVGGDSNDIFMVGGGNNNTLDGEGGDRNTIVNVGVGTTFNNVVDITPRPFELDLKVDIGSGADNVISTSISFNLFDFNVDLMTTDGAIDALGDIDALISQVTEQLTNIGSTINRLESVKEAQNIKLNNLISSRSTIQDADIARESSQFIRSQILQQAAATLMSASANLRRDSILGILNSVSSSF